MTNVKIDRVIFQNIEILEIRNVKRLEELGVIEPAQKKGVCYCTLNGERFKKLNIENDGFICKFFASARVFQNKLSRYCHLTVTVKDENSTNLECFSVTDYYDKLEEIMNYLDDRYGIIVDFSDLTVKEIELNKTIELSNPFESYHRPLQLLYSILPNTFCTKGIWSNREQNNDIPRTYSASTQKSNKSKHYKVHTMYDKSKQLEQRLKVDKQYLRWELRLVGAEKVKKELGTNRFAEITDELLNEFMTEQHEKIFVKPLNRWRADRDKLVKRLIVEERAKNKHWIVNTLRRLQDLEIADRKPYVLDIQDVIDVFLMTSKDSTRRKNEIKNLFERQATKYETTMAQNDHDKINELMTKLVA